MSKFADLPPHKQKAVLLLTRQIVDPDAPRLTYEQIAEECGVSRNTLFEWRTQDEAFMAARKEIVDKYADEIVSDAFYALKYQVSRNKNVKAAEVLLKSRGMLVDRKEVNADIKAQVSDVSEQSNDELMRELEALRAKTSAE